MAMGAVPSRRKATMALVSNYQTEVIFMRLLEEVVRESFERTA
jgi:hypothetical protein